MSALKKHVALITNVQKSQYVFLNWIRMKYLLIAENLT
jgi:hypothetical protein